MSGERPSFETRAAAEEYCREREREDADASWLAFEADGSWTAVRTNLPRHEDPMGTATESKPKLSPAATVSVRWARERWASDGKSRQGAGCLLGWMQPWLIRTGPLSKRERWAQR